MAPEIPYAGEVPLVPNVRPVVVASGSDYEMGYQHYHQIVQIFGPFFLERLAHDDFTDDELATLKAYQWHIRRDTPEMIDYMRGMAAGATDAGVRLSYMDVLADITGAASYPDVPSGSDEEELPPSDCSGFAAWGSATRDGRLVCGG